MMVENYIKKVDKNGIQMMNINYVEEKIDAIKKKIKEIKGID